MAITEQISTKLDIPFKNFQQGRYIYSHEMNDDMNDIEFKVNQIIDKHNETVKTKDEHVANVSNPHNVTASQLGVYTKEEVDNLIKNIIKAISE